MDRFDSLILQELARNGRATQHELAAAARLSGTAAGRRQRALEERGYITGYHASLDMERLDLAMVVTVLIRLDRQSNDALDAFENAVVSCQSVTACYLLSGGEDYVVSLRVKDLADFERIHREELSHLPGVTRMQSLFALREVVSRQVPQAAFERLAR